MGTWGTYPKDSDGAMDLLGHVNQAIIKSLKKIKPNKKYPYEYAGLIMALLQRGFSVPYESVLRAEDCIKTYLKRTIDGNPMDWSNPRKALKDMRVVLRAFRKLLDDHSNYFLKSRWLGGKKDIKFSKRQRLNRLRKSNMLAPKKWLSRKNDICGRGTLGN